MDEQRLKIRQKFERELFHQNWLTRLTSEMQSSDQVDAQRRNSYYSLQSEAFKA